MLDTPNYELNGIIFEPQFYGATLPINTFDPREMRRIGRFINEINKMLGGILPCRVGLGEGNPAEVGVTHDHIGLDIQSLSFYGEQVFAAVLVHEGAHIKYGDTTRLNSTLLQTYSLNNFEYLREVFEENPASCCGLALRTFGNMDVFHQNMRQASDRMRKVRDFYTKIGISPNTRAAQLADKLIADKDAQQQIERLRDLFPESNKADPIKVFFDSFFGTTIAWRKKNAERYGVEYIDYVSFLPDHEVDKQTAIKRFSEIYQDHMPFMELAFHEIKETGRVIQQATEHRADHEIAVMLGPKLAIKMTTFLQQHYNELRNNLPEDQREEFDQNMMDEHPHPDDRILFIQERFPEDSVLCHLSDERPKTCKPHRPPTKRSGSAAAPLQLK